MLPTASILFAVIAVYAVNAAQKCAGKQHRLQLTTQLLPNDKMIIVTMPMEGTIWKTGEEVTIGW